MNQRYRPDIDGLRTVAILPVILFHAGFGCTGGFVGVDIFFVISGFLITSLILKEINEGVFSLAAFWERRIRRILPALFVVVFACLVATWFLYLPADFALVGQSVMAQMVLMSNVFFWLHGEMNYFAPSVDTMPLLHTWSLAVEEQFYVIFPLLLIFLARRKFFSITRAIVCLGVVSLALGIVGTYEKPTATFYLLPTRAWELMAGAFIASITVRQFAKAWMNEAAGWSGLGLILWPIFFYTRETRFPGMAAIPPCLGTALIIFSGGARPALINRALALRPFVFVGLISYSLYLWHWPLLAFSKYASVNPDWKLRAALLLVSFVLAVASWKWIETPFRKRLYCPRRPQVFALAGCSILTLVLLGGGVYFKHGMPCRISAEAAHYLDSQNDYGFRNEITPEQAAAGQFAELGGQSTNQPIKILIWGDSHAMSIAPVLDELCRKYSVRGVEATHSSTAPILGYISRTSRFSLQEDSLAFSQSVVDFIARQHIKFVIIAAFWNRYGPPDLVDAKLAATCRAISASGASVYLLKDVPMPGFDVPRQVAFTVLHHGDPKRLGTPPDKYLADNHDYISIFNHCTQSGATVLDTPKCFLNPNGLYDVFRDEKVLYYDTQHLTVDGSRLLTPLFEPFFQTK